MKSTTYSYFKYLSQKLALALPVALVICAPSALAQSALQSNGNAGSLGNTSNITLSGGNGNAPVTTGFTTKQLSSPTMGNLQLNPTGYGGLAPVFGGSGYGWIPTTSGLNIDINAPGLNVDINMPGVSGYPTPGPPGGELGLSAPGFGAVGGDFGSPAGSVAALGTLGADIGGSLGGGVGAAIGGAAGVAAGVGMASDFGF